MEHRNTAFEHIRNLLRRNTMALRRHLTDFCRNFLPSYVIDQESPDLWTFHSIRQCYIVEKKKKNFFKFYSLNIALRFILFTFESSSSYRLCHDLHLLADVAISLVPPYSAPGPDSLHSTRLYIIIITIVSISQKKRDFERKLNFAAILFHSNLPLSIIIYFLNFSNKIFSIKLFIWSFTQYSVT